MSASNDLTKEILINLSYNYGNGCHAFRANVIVARARRGTVRSLPNGTPDVLACIYGRSTVIEVKVDDDMSKDQENFKAVHQNAGGLHILAREWVHVKLALTIAGLEPQAGWRPDVVAKVVTQRMPMAVGR